MKKEARFKKPRPAGGASRFVRCLIIFAFSLAVLPLEALEAGDLPSGAEICDHYVEVTGGREAYAETNNSVSKGKFAMPAQGIVMDITTYTARPDLFYTIIESPAIGKIERGVVDGVAWENSMMTGPSVKEGKERDQMINNAVFNKMANWRKVYKSAECTADTTLGGKECYKVILTPVKGQALTSYFEKDSGLLVMTSTIVHSQMGEIPAEVHLSDYRQVGDLKVSFKSTVKVMGQNREITLESVEYDVDIPEGTFELPEAIKSIVKQKESEGKKAE